LALLKKNALQARGEHLGQNHIREASVRLRREKKARQFGSIRNDENGFPRPGGWALPGFIYQILQDFCYLAVALPRLLSRHFHRDRKEFLIVTANMTLKKSYHLTGIGHYGRMTSQDRSGKAIEALRTEGLNGVYHN
jgi:hypothetical protein